MKFSKLPAVLLLVIALCWSTVAWTLGLREVVMMSSQEESGSTVIFSQTAYDSFYITSMHAGVRFELDEQLGVTTMTFEPNISAAGASCEIRFGDDYGADLTDGNYIVADTFTSVEGVNSVQITTGNITAGTYVVGFKCDTANLRMNTEVDASLVTRASTASWDLISNSGYDLTLRALKP